MFRVFFNVLLGFCASLLRIVLIPLNALISNTLPDLSETIVLARYGVVHIFDNIAYALDFLPSTVVVVLQFIITVEIAKHTIHFSAEGLRKLWVLLDKILPL